MGVQLLSQILRHAQERPEAPAVVECRRSEARGISMDTWSYGRLAAEVSAITSQFKRMTPAGSVVVIALPNGQALTASFLATLAAGRTAFLVSPHLNPHEMDKAVTRAEAGLVVVTDAAAQARPTMCGIPVVAVSALQGTPEHGNYFNPEGAKSAGMYLLSSGTTDQPRLVDRRAAALDAVAENIAAHVGHSAGHGLGPDDCVLAVIPQCHSYGVESALMGPLFAGAALMLCQGLDTMVVNEIWRREAVTVFPATPSILDMLARSTEAGEGSDSPRSARAAKPVCVYSAGATLPGSVARAYEERFGIPVGQLYGASEAGSLTFIHGEHHPDSTCVGTPFANVDLKIVDPDQGGLVDLPRESEGEVAVRARSMLSRYVGAEHSCTTDGYWRSGDLGRWDHRGRLHITGRRKFLIDVGPEKVNPMEVEAVLREHPGVADCVVASIAVTETVSRLRAVVVRKNGAESSGEDLRQFLRDRLSAYKVPRMYEFRTELPRSSAGKILRREV